MASSLLGAACGVSGVPLASSRAMTKRNRVIRLLPLHLLRNDKRRSIMRPPVQSRCFRIAKHVTGGRIDPQVAAQLVGNISQMHQRDRHRAFFYRSVKLGLVPRPERVNEIGPVVARLDFLRPGLLLPAEKALIPVIAFDGEVALVAEENI